MFHNILFKIQIKRKYFLSKMQIIFLLFDKIQLEQLLKWSNLKIVFYEISN